MILRFFLRPYFQLLVCAVTGTASEVFLKIGAARTASLPSPWPWLGISGLESRYVWIGIVFTILSFLAWMQALRSIPLGVAFTLSNVVHVLVPLSCWLFLGEVINDRRLVGVGFIVLGLLVIAKPFARLDARI